MSRAFNLHISSLRLRSSSYSLSYLFALSELFIGYLWDIFLSILRRTVRARNNSSFSIKHSNYEQEIQSDDRDGIVLKVNKLPEAMKLQYAENVFDGTHHPNTGW